MAQPQRRGRIRNSLLLLLFAVGVVPLIATSWTLSSWSRDTLEVDEKQIQQNSVKSLSQQVAVYVRSLQSQVATMALTLEMNTGKGRFADRIAEIDRMKPPPLERYIGEPSHFYYMSVVDTTCQGPYSGVQLPEPVIQEFLQEGCKRGTTKGEPLVSQPVWSSSLQEPIVVLGQPVRPGGQEAPVQGALLAVASLLPVWTMTKEAAHVGIMEVYIVDSRGHLIAHSDLQRMAGDPDVSSIQIVQDFILSKGGAVSSTEPFGIPTSKGLIRMLGTYTRVPDDSGWGVIAQVDEAKAYYSAIQMRKEAFFFVGIMAIVATVFGVLFAQKISRPIQELAQGARRLAGGHYETRVSAKGRNEVGILGEAFNQMGAEIQKSIEAIRRAAETNKELFMGSIRMLANAIDEKDPYTRGHSERVAFYSAIIAKHLGMNEEEVEKVHLSGIIHDVGKIGIEDKILRKASALTDDEYEIMKQHPRKGEHILAAVPILKAMAGAGLMHHENVDGSGYPDGLKGDQIPLLGRIVSVADAFDAMTTDRPYSKAMTFEAALARLRFLAGKKFDVGCVEAIERASASGDLTPGKARRASVVSRQQAPQPVS